MCWVSSAFQLLCCPFHNSELGHDHCDHCDHGLSNSWKVACEKKKKKYIFWATEPKGTPETSHTNRDTTHRLFNTEGSPTESRHKMSPWQQSGQRNEQHVKIMYHLLGIGFCVLLVPFLCFFYLAVYQKESDEQMWTTEPQVRAWLFLTTSNVLNNDRPSRGVRGSESQMPHSKKGQNGN